MRHKRLPPKPEAPANGIYLMDPWTKQEVFVPFNELQSMCREILSAPDWETGKPSWRDDPTYNLRRKK